MDQSSALFGNSTGDALVAVAEVADGDTGGEVEIFNAVIIPKSGTFAAHKHLSRCVSRNYIPGEFFICLVKKFANLNYTPSMVVVMNPVYSEFDWKSLIYTLFPENASAILDNLLFYGYI